MQRHRTPPQSCATNVFISGITTQFLFIKTDLNDPLVKAVLNLKFLDIILMIQLYRNKPKLKF